MELYFSPFACSLAARVALYDAGHPATFVQVDNRAKRTERGEDFLAINPAGMVPVVRLDDGELLTENSAILAYLDTQMHPDRTPIERARLQRWIGFINSELHTGCFSAILDSTAPPEVHAYSLERVKKRFALLDAHLKGRDFLMDEFTVADAYLAVVANWVQVRGPDLAAYPELSRYLAGLRARPGVARAMGEELQLYLEEQKRLAS
ncbi:MAG: glutathione S-transferase N-terminal domain-containing protein [Hyphomonas sp.]|nr:glutathione S-transferase N-terminal domain-containing protein [Hyphomonas sp.]